MLVGNFADVLAAPERIGRDGSPQVYEDQLGTVLDFLTCRHRVGQLVVSLQGTDIVIWYGPAETHPIVILLLRAV